MWPHNPKEAPIVTTKTGLDGAIHMSAKSEGSEDGASQTGRELRVGESETQATDIRASHALILCTRYMIIDVPHIGRYISE